MDCRQAREWAALSLDRELEARSEGALAEHMASCADCRAFRQQQEGVLATVRLATYYRADASLRARIVGALPATDRSPIERSKWRRYVWPMLTGAIAATCVALVLALFLPLQISSDDRLLDQLVASHARAMLTNHVIDVASSDQHTVKPWFNGKVDFSPPVGDLADHGFPLLGGRLDYLDHRLVAVLVYSRRQHVIDVFIWPAEAAVDSKLAPKSAQGYHVVGKTSAGMRLLAVSDVDPGELQQFIDLL